MNCSTPNCLNDVAAYRKVCDKCRYRIWRAKNPLRYAYNTLKFNAKRRGIEFDLPFDYWVSFCKENGYMELKGVGSEALTVERSEDSKGYVVGNVVVMKKKDNVTKENKRRAKKVILSEAYHKQWEPGGVHHTPIPW